MRYYCTDKRGQVVVESSTTIISTDSRVANFFQSTPSGYRKAYTEDSLPFNELIPIPTQAELDAIANTNRINEIDSRLNQIDLESIRSIRAFTRGNSNQTDTDKLEALDTESETLRTERATLI